MKTAHFRNLRPVCPRCRRDSGALIALEVVHETPNAETAGGRIEILACPAHGCRQEYPVIDGMPVLVPDVRGWVQANEHDILARRDLSDELGSLLGDCLDPAGPHNVTRHNVSAYAASHFGTGEDKAGQGTIHEVLSTAVAMAGPLPPGPVLDLGCAVGGTSFHLAGALEGRLVLGMDLGFGLLRVAGEVLETGEAVYDLRTNGLVYRRCRRPLTQGPAGPVDFWVGDASALPFAPGKFAMVCALNLLDCVHSPVTVLQQIDAALVPGGVCLLATPFDWAASATPVEGWIGGHSRRAGDGGCPVTRLRAILADGDWPLPGMRLRLVGARTVPWAVRLHDRAQMLYQSELMVLSVPAGQADIGGDGDVA